VLVATDGGSALVCTACFTLQLSARTGIILQGLAGSGPGRVSVVFAQLVHEERDLDANYQGNG